MKTENINKIAISFLLVAFAALTFGGVLSLSANQMESETVGKSQFDGFQISSCGWTMEALDAFVFHLLDGGTLDAMDFFVGEITINLAGFDTYMEHSSVVYSGYAEIEPFAPTCCAEMWTAWGGWNQIIYPDGSVLFFRVLMCVSCATIHDVEWR